MTFTVTVTLSGSNQVVPAGVTTVATEVVLTTASGFYIGGNYIDENHQVAFAGLVGGTYHMVATTKDQNGVELGVINDTFTHEEGTATYFLPSGFSISFS
ncbi:hypothetical protein UFOVP67_9 [uncultured Caudovirales phage]|uniref:Uncharacterized protein n=1 Tax=uncultured Caudovirales phage TaxID=2100421 RepID=A0A6J5TCB8_9CAUD|nr:hypothetical protein UFOVP67_9 [uncultured Caudovirales phage]